MIAAMRAPQDRYLWIAFGVAAALNLVWLMIEMRTPLPTSRDVIVYAECRAAVRRERGSNLRFPTADLVRFAEIDSARVTLHGYFEVPGDGQRTRYTCHAGRAASGWRVERLMVEP